MRLAQTQLVMSESRQPYLPSESRQPYLPSESRQPYLPISTDGTLPSTSAPEQPLVPAANEIRKAQIYSRSSLRRSYSPTQRTSASLEPLSSDKMRLAGLLNGPSAQSQPASCASASPGIPRRAAFSAKRGRTWDRELPNRAERFGSSMSQVRPPSSPPVPPNVENPCPPSQTVPSQSHPDTFNTPGNFPGAEHMPKMRTGLSTTPMARSAETTPTPRQQSNFRFTPDSFLASPSGSSASLPLEYLPLDASRFSSKRLRSNSRGPVLAPSSSISPKAPTARSHTLPSLNAVVSIESTAAQLPEAEPLGPIGIQTQFSRFSHSHAIPPLHEGVSESRRTAHAHPQKGHIRPPRQEVLSQPWCQTGATPPMALSRYGAYPLERNAQREIVPTQGQYANAGLPMPPPVPPENRERQVEYYEQYSQIGAPAEQIFPRPSYNIRGQSVVLPTGDGIGKMPPDFDPDPSSRQLLPQQQPAQEWLLKAGIPHVEQVPSSLPRQNSQTRSHSVQPRGAAMPGRSGGTATGSNNECENCRKVFRTKQGYLRHKQTVHLKKRPFKCDQCGANFGQKCSLQRHQKAVHHDIDIRFECEHEGCAWAFSEYRLLQAHIKQFHDGAPPFQCRVRGCTASFMWSSSHDNHMISSHTAAERSSVGWAISPSSGV